VSIPRRTKRAMLKEMCGTKLMDKRNTDELMNLLGLRETAGKSSKSK